LSILGVWGIYLALAEYQALATVLIEVFAFALPGMVRGLNSLQNVLIGFIQNEEDFKNILAPRCF